MIKRALLISIPLLCTACGTFQLANNIQAPSGKSVDQQQSDILVCKDKAKMAASTAGKQTEAFLLGLTIVGAPAAYNIDKKTQREAFASCMRAKGYTLQVADDNQKVVASTPQQQQQPKISQTTSPVNENNATRITEKTANVSNNNTENKNTARLEALKKMLDEGLISQSDYDKKKLDILNSM